MFKPCYFVLIVEEVSRHFVHIYRMKIGRNIESMGKNKGPPVILVNIHTIITFITSAVHLQEYNPNLRRFDVLATPVIQVVL